MPLAFPELDSPSLLAAGEALPQMGLLAAVAAVCALLFVSQRRRKRDRDPSMSGYARELRSQIRDESAQHKETGELAIDLEAIARRITAEVDTRLAKLETVIRHADQRIEQLKRLLGSEGGSSACDWSVADQSSQAAPPDAAPGADSHAKVIALAEAGLGGSDIAHRLKLPSAEVELILAMGRPRISPVTVGRPNSIA